MALGDQLRRRRAWSAAGVMAVAFVLLTVVARADAPAVVINEIMWDGTEYVELLNTTEENIDLSGWQLTRQALGGEVKTMVEFDEENVIAAGDYYLIEKSEAATDIAADNITSALILVNTGEQLVLQDVTGAVVDTANTLGAWFAGENTSEGVAMERTDAASDGTSEESWHTSTGEVGGRFGTPGEANSEPLVNEAPEAMLTGPSNGEVSEEIIFSAEDSTDPDGDTLTFTWDLGDRTTAIGSAVVHAYASAGHYTIRVTVSDGELEDTATLTVSIKQPNYSEDIVINEFLPNPVGADTANEFIELLNTGSEAVNLGGWQLDDQADSGSSPYTIPSGTSISGHGIKAFSRSDTKIVLNNSGDSVRLLDPSGDEKDSASYSETVPDGYSYNRNDDGDYVLSTTVTEGRSNIITKPVDEDEEESEASKDLSTGSGASAKVINVELKDVRDEDVGTILTTSGVVSVPPGVFGERMIYLAGSGIQVYFSKGDFPDLALGDIVQLTGELSSASGEARIKLAQATDIKTTKNGGPPPAHIIATSAVDEATEGSLVTIQGQVSQTSGDTFYVDDGSGEVKVYIKSTTDIDKPKMNKGINVTITGVVSETSSGYRILPRFQEDIRMGLVAGLTSFPNTGLGQGFVLPAGLMFISLALFSFGYRAKEPLLWRGLNFRANRA